MKDTGKRREMGENLANRRKNVLFTEIDKDFTQLSVLKRREIFAKAWNRKRGEEASREQQAKVKGFASYAAYERVTAQRARREKSEGKSWNQLGDFAAKGHAALEQDRRAIHELLEFAAIQKKILPQDFVGFKNNQASRKLSLNNDTDSREIDEMAKMIREQVACELEREGAFGEVTTKDLENKMKRLENELNEMMTMRFEEFQSIVAAIAANHDENDAESLAKLYESAEVRFYYSALDADTREMEDRYNPRIEAAHRRLKRAREELEHAKERRIALETERRLACWLYTETCIAKKLPESRRLLLNFGQDKVELCNQDIQGEHLRVVLFCIGLLSNLRELVLTENRLRADGCETLCKQLEVGYMNQLVVLDLSNNLIDSEGAMLLFTALREKENAVSELNLAYNRIGESCPKVSLAELSFAFFKLLKANKTLRTLDLSSNPLSEEFSFAVGDSLKASTALETLRLRFCPLGGPGRMNLLENLLVNKHLTALDISMTNMDDSDAQLVAEKLSQKSCSLAWLNVSGNARISAEGCGFIAEALQINRSLRHLKMEDCGFGIEGCRELLDSLGKNETLEELECDHEKCLYNPLCADGTLEKVVYMSLANEVETFVEVKEFLSLPRIQAGLLVKETYHGFSQVPELDDCVSSSADFLNKVTFDDCFVGMECLVQPFEREDGPWLNARVTEILPRLEQEPDSVDSVRVLLVDFLVPVDEDFQEYEPLKTWDGSVFKLPEAYPVISPDRIRTARNDLAVLEVGLVQKQKQQMSDYHVEIVLDDEHGEPKRVLFPITLLPSWMQVEGSKGFLKTFEVSPTKSSQVGPVFAVNTDAKQGFFTMGSEKELVAINKGQTKRRSAEQSGEATDTKQRGEQDIVQTPIIVRWPLKAFQPKPRLQERVVNRRRSVLPTLLSSKERALRSRKLGGESRVYFMFYKTHASVTASLRILKLQD